MNAILFAAVLCVCSVCFASYLCILDGNNVRSSARLLLQSQLFMHTMSPLVLISLDMLNERIRALRLAKGLTLQQVGDVFGISRASVSAWESGLAKPDATKLVRLAELLETSLSNLLEGSDGADSPGEVEALNTVVPFIRWDLIEKNSRAQNPSQHVNVSHSNPPMGSFATRLIAPADWSWQPGPIPAGAILIISPCKVARSGKISLISSPEHALQLATLQRDKSAFTSTNHLENGASLQIKAAGANVYGEVLEWQLQCKVIC